MQEFIDLFSALTNNPVVLVLLGAVVSAATGAFVQSRSDRRAAKRAIAEEQRVLAEAIADSFYEVHTTVRNAYQTSENYTHWEEWYSEWDKDEQILPTLRLIRKLRDDKIHNQFETIISALLIAPKLTPINRINTYANVVYAAVLGTQLAEALYRGQKPTPKVQESFRELEKDFAKYHEADSESE